MSESHFGFKIKNIQLFYIAKSSYLCKLVEGLRMKKNFSSHGDEEVTILQVLSITMLPDASQDTRSQNGPVTGNGHVGDESTDGWAGDLFETCSPSHVGQFCVQRAPHSAAVQAACTPCAVHHRERADGSPTSVIWPAPDLPVSSWNI